MVELNFGIVGPGYIAGVVADAIAKSAHAALTAVASRSLERARAFVAERDGAAPVEGWAALIARADVDAIYIATPTVAKEEIALAAVAAGKHILVDKPFLDAGSVRRMAEAAANAGLVFMDGTHFVHHPRTRAIQAATAEKIGAPRSLHTAFYFPFDDHQNIRFDPTQEPTGALGDLAWYSMRATVEYLRPAGAIATVSAVADRDAATGAVKRVVGLIGFESGEVATFDTGYTTGTILMDFALHGTTGVIMMDDFVLDWHNSLAFQDPDMIAGYVHRTGMATRKEFTFVETPSSISQQTLMVDDFAALAASGDELARAEWSATSQRTQACLDAVWAVIAPA